MQIILQETTVKVKNKFNHKTNNTVCSCLMSCKQRWNGDGCLLSSHTKTECFVLKQLKNGQKIFQNQVWSLNIFWWSKH